MKKFQNIKINNQSIELLEDNKGLLWFPLKSVTNILGLDYENELMRIQKDLLLNKIIKNGHCPLVYSMGYVGSTENNNLDPSFNEKKLQCYKDFYNFLTNELEEV